MRKETLKCDWCAKEIDHPFYITVKRGKDERHFCNYECLINWVDEAIKVRYPPQEYPTQ